METQSYIEKWQGNERMSCANNVSMLQDYSKRGEDTQFVICNEEEEEHWLSERLQKRSDGGGLSECNYLTSVVIKNTESLEEHLFTGICTEFCTLSLLSHWRDLLYACNW